jgi:hypothetical protein
MKTLLRPLLLFVLVWSIGVEAAPPSTGERASLGGTVLEVKDVGQYTYLRLKTNEGEQWAAVTAAPVKVGAEVDIVDPQPMNGFHSRSLNRTFDRIVFGTVTVRGGAAASPDVGAMHAAAGKGQAVAPVKVEKAKGPNAQTVAGIVTGAASLKDKPVTVRGQVVRFNADVMGKNWLHLRDGTGSSADGSNDVLVVTGSKASIGDLVMVSGTVRTDRNFGSGYTYKVLIDDAKVTK